MSRSDILRRSIDDFFSEPVNRDTPSIFSKEKTVDFSSANRVVYYKLFSKESNIVRVV